MINNPNAEADFVGYMHRLRKGSTGIEYGHSMMTLEGRTVQSFLSGADVKLDTMLQTYKQLENERNLLKLVSETVGQSPETLLRQMRETPQIVAEMLAKKGGLNPLLDELIATGKLSPDGLQSIGKMFEKGAPYNREMFFAEAMDAIEENAMRQAVMQFGVQSKGVVTRWADAMKAAETLAFLRISPGYPIRNAINNEITMLSRGLFGVMDNGVIDDFWKGFGMTPARLGGSAGPAELAGKLSKADEVIMDALKGGQYGTPEKVGDFFKNMNLGKLDFAKNWGGKIEQSARRRSQTLGTMQYLRKYFKPKSVKEYASTSGILDQLPDDIAKSIDNAIRSSGASETKLDEIMGGNLNLNMDSILDDASRASGVDMREVLGDEVLEYMHQKLPAAIANGKTGDIKLELRNLLEKQSEAWFQKSVGDIVEHTKAQAMAGGPNIWNAKMGEAQDIFWGAHMEHSNRMQEVSALAREAASSGDFKAASALWEQAQNDGRMFYDRAFRRVDAYVQGLEEGTAELGRRGANLPFTETRRTFKEWRGMWGDFFETRNKMYSDFFEASKSKKPASWDELQAKTQKLFDDSVGKEDAFSQRLDDTIANMIDDPQAKQAYIGARDELSKLRLADKKDVSATYEAAQDLSGGERQAMMNELQQRRMAAFQKMREVDQRSIFIQQGDAESIVMFEGAATGGTRNDRRILDTANKYAGAEPAASAIPISKATEVPRSELPPAVSERFGQEAKRLQNELSGGEAGKRTAEGAIGTTNAPWYREAYQNGLRKPQIDKALDKIIIDQGADKGTTVEKVKEIIFDNFKYGDAKSGTPPDLYVLQELGADKKVMQEALDEFNSITKQELTLEDAIAASTPSGLHDPNLPYYDDAGKLVQPKKYTRVEDIPPDVMKKAIAEEATKKGIPAKAGEVNPAYIADVNKALPPMKPMDLATDQLNYGRIQPAIDKVISQAEEAARRAPSFVKDLAPDMQNEIKRVMGLVKNDLSSVRHQAVKFGEWRADSALLNYNRRTNFDNFLGHIAPFGFWTTNSAFKWAVESIDRPAMLTNYLRTKKFMATAGLQRDGQASRTKGKIRIPLPFAPEWMGEAFVDPMRLALPFDNWAAPFEQLQKSNQGFDGQVQRTMEQLVADGKISQADYESALEDKSGATWDYAASVAEKNASDDRYDAFDFATALQAPHAPLMWAYNAAFGNKEDIGPFAPVSKQLRNAATMLGVKDWNNSKWNVEARIRKHLGLPAFDKWDDYRIKRAAGNLAGEGKLTPDEMKEAIAVAAMVESGQLDSEEAKQQSEAYDIAVTRSNQEFTGGGVSAVLGLFGIGVTTVPKGENALRALQDDFGAAYGKYAAADESLDAFLDAHPEMDEETAADTWERQNPKLAKDASALGDFFDAHPEYEGRLGLFDKPEEQVKKFYVDQLWKVYNEMPKVNQDEAREQLGGDFQQAFLDSATRDYDSIEPGTMAVWMKLMGVDPLGGLNAEQRLLVNLYGKVQFTEPEMANRVQTFYDHRKQNFPEFYDQQSEYYSLTNKGEKKQYLNAHPELKAYFDFRSSFMNDNPDIVPYITDSEKAIADAKNKTRTQNAVPTAQELKINIDPQTSELLSHYLQSGQPLPPALQSELDYIGGQYGISGENVLNIYGGGQGIR
jgi:hypothetical protein